MLEGWTKSSRREGWFNGPNGEFERSLPSKAKPEGAIALADAIKTNGAIETITFGDKQAVTMKADMTEANLSSKELGASGAIIAAAFIPKCQ